MTGTIREALTWSGTGATLLLFCRRGGCADPTRDFDLYIELLESDVPRARVIRADGAVVVEIYPAEHQVRIPARWLASILERAEVDLAGS